MEREALSLAMDGLERILGSFEKDGKFVRSSMIRNELFNEIHLLLVQAKKALAQPAQEEKKMYVDRIMCGVSRAEWHDRAWELYQAKAFDDCMLPKNVSIHTLRTIFNATYDSFGKDAMKEALAQPAQEPEATVTSESGNPNVTMSWWHEPALPVGTKLYTTPPQREWVGLTDEQQEEMYQMTDNIADCRTCYFKGIADAEAAHNRGAKP